MNLQATRAMVKTIRERGHIPLHEQKDILNCLDLLLEHAIRQEERIAQQSFALATKQEGTERRNQLLSKYQKAFCELEYMFGEQPDLSAWIKRLMLAGANENRLKELREMCGHWQNGSCTDVHIYEDDATHTWIVLVGKKRYYGDTFDEALNIARWTEFDQFDGFF